jgi:hypothetical protein
MSVSEARRAETDGPSGGESSGKAGGIKEDIMENHQLRAFVAIAQTGSFSLLVTRR